MLVTKTFRFLLTTIVFFCPYNGSKWEPKLSGYQHSSKYLHMCNGIEMFWFTIPLSVNFNWKRSILLFQNQANINSNCKSLLSLTHKPSDWQNAKCPAFCLSHKRQKLGLTRNTVSISINQSLWCNQKCSTTKGKVMKRVKTGRSFLSFVCTWEVEADANVKLLSTLSLYPSTSPQSYARLLPLPLFSHSGSEERERGGRDQANVKAWSWMRRGACADMLILWAEANATAQRCKQVQFCPK